MPRRKKNNSAFEFTGDEAEAAEQAFRLRHAHHARKPKISVTSISPLSAISKLLHSRSPITRSPSQQRNLRAHSKLSKKATSRSNPTQRATENVRQLDKRARPPETPISSPSLHTPSPARRSHRRRIPTFKLRGSTKPALETAGDTSHSPPAAIETRPEANLNQQEASNEGIRDEPLGISHADGLKRSRVDCDADEGDGHDMTVVPRVKRRRSYDELDHAKRTLADTANENDSGVGVEQLDSIDKDHAPTSIAKQLDQSKSEAELKRIQGDPVVSDKHGIPDVEKADDDGEGTGDGVARQEKETSDSEPAEKVLLTWNESDTVGNETAEQNIETETLPSSGVRDAVEPTESNEKDDWDVCDLLLSEDRFQSPVTPQKAVAGVDICGGPSQDEQNNDRVRTDAQKQEQNEAKKGETDVRNTLVQDYLSTDVGIEETAAKDVNVEAPVEESEKESEKEGEDAKTASSESTAEKVPNSSEKDEEGDAITETNTSLKSEEKQEPGQARTWQARTWQARTWQPRTWQPRTWQPRTWQPRTWQPRTWQPRTWQARPGNQEPGNQEPGNQEPEPTAKGSVPRCESEKETDMGGKETETSTKRSSTTQRLRDVVERLSPGKQQSGVTKRVRFSEPSQPYRASERKLGFSGIVKMRRRRARRHRALDTDLADVSVTGAGTNDSNKKDRHLLLDELQYLLDGIFSKFTNGNKKGQAPDNDVVASSLQALIRLLLKRPAKSSTASEEKEDDDSAVIVQILSEQPDLLKKIVIRFCSALGKSKTSDALLALVFVLIFRATPKLTLISEHELDLLLNAFFRSSGSSLKYNERDGQKPVDEKKQTGKEPQAKRRGKLGRMLEQKKQKDDSLPQLLELMSASDIMEAGCTAFKTEADAAAHLMGTAISLLLRNESESRVWMRQNRRLDRVVAILYSCEKIMLSQAAKENDPDHGNSPAIETGASWIVMEASLRVLEFAVLDPVCQQRLARESRVGSIIVDLLRTIKSIKTGPLESEWMICAALRLCINLCHGCEDASKQLVDSKGHEVVLNCLVKECLAASLLQKDPALPVPEDTEESFDVRVLCLAALASTVNQETSVCNSFHKIHAESIQDSERNAISLILEMLRTAELESKREEGRQNCDEAETGTIRRKKIAKAEEAERERRAQFIIERKITIGYVCLLVGAMACDSKPNRERIQGRLPGQSFLGIAAVLAEFLEFHHEVGVISGSMNRMYAEIIKKIVEPEAINDGAAGVMGEPKGKNESTKADKELSAVGSDVMNVQEGEEEEKDKATENTEQEEPADSEACEKTAPVIESMQQSL